MNRKTKFELYRWFYFFLLWFVGMGLCISIIEVIVGPLLQWLLYGIPYQFPTWDSSKGWALWVLSVSFFAGTLSWYYEKRSTGR